MTEKDKNEILSHGITIEEFEKQMINFIKGFAFVELSSPAIKNDGIIVLDEKEISNMISLYEKEKENYSITKFVPASGAATRMFKDLFEFTSSYMGLPYTLKNFTEAEKTINNLEKFAFYLELKEKFLQNNTSLEEYLEKKDYTTIVNYILSTIGLNYGKMPKALISFHKYTKENRVRKAIEEHFVEASFYAVEKTGNINLHFTISPEHKKDFIETINSIKPYYEDLYKVKYNIELSFQKPSTDTIAVNMDNTMFYDKKGNIVFRPSGHGALIENLNEIDSDVIFIKNIDNVSHDKIKAHTYKYKKLLGGILLNTQKEVFSILNKLEKETLNSGDIVSIIELTNKLGINLSQKEKEDKDILKILHNKLNRPIRVCAMVKKTNEIGGGPFWVRDTKTNTISLQIIEGAQVDLKSEKQSEIFSSSTHFNPVDMVCATKNYKGEKFNLNCFTDETTGFISIKSYDGKEIKAQEKPGLWNGGMAKWITLFVEVPLETFTPVKTINDLLRAEHQE
ncbi:MAG: DUF4301 family protein [Bacteroidales bacterium]|jgi:hypothetical protein|nr:DUF4301 family protein [Bacteroidales bacterium]